MQPCAAPQAVQPACLRAESPAPHPPNAVHPAFLRLLCLLPAALTAGLQRLHGRLHARWMVLAATCLLAACGYSPAPQVLRLQQALVAPGQFVEAAPAVAASAPPTQEQINLPDLPNSQPVGLPDEWAQTRPGFTGTVLYRLRFTWPLPAPTPASAPPGQLLALYVERACSSLQVVLNGQLLHNSGEMLDTTKAASKDGPADITKDSTKDSVAYSCNHPHLVALPASALQQGGNVLDLKVSGHALTETGSRQRAGGLSTLLLGPHDLLASRYQRHLALQVQAPQAVSATLVLMGGFMFVLGFFNRRDSHLAYFGALSVGWALLSTRVWMRELPLEHSSIEFLGCVTAARGLSG
jgi:two-component system, NarL family, sensor histidine kinase UhpB